MSLRNTMNIPPGGITPPAVNFDYAVLAKEQGANPTWLYAAEALLETNEGFDVRTKVEYEWVEVYLIRGPDSEWEACPDASGQNATKSEPWVA